MQSLCEQTFHAILYLENSLVINLPLATPTFTIIHDNMHCNESLLYPDTITISWPACRRSIAITIPLLLTPHISLNSTQDYNVIEHLESPGVVVDTIVRVNEGKQHTNKVVSGLRL